MINFIKKYWSELLLSVFFIFMLTPQTRTPIQVFIQRIISQPPTTFPKNKQQKLSSFDFNYVDQSDTQYNLRELKGGVTLINFWATWCPPCIAEMPSFKRLYSTYKDEINFLFITNDEWETINSFEEKRKYNLPFYRLQKGNNSLNATQLPTTYLIDKNGIVVLTHVGVADWDSKSFKEKLNKLIQEP